jgi:DNA-binding response OmpR family regulator
MILLEIREKAVMQVPEKIQILLVEDDAMIASGLVYALEQEGYAVTHCGSVRAVREAIGRDDAPQLALLDMQLPDGTGFEVKNALPADTAVIFLTVVDDEGNIIKAFESGADDYITKPFRLRELLARMKRTLQSRSGGQLGQPGQIGQSYGGGQPGQFNPPGSLGQPGSHSQPGQLIPPSSVLTLGDVHIDTASGKATIRGGLLDLTALEYRLLLTFAQNRGRILSRAQILENIWDAAGSFVEDNTLTVYIKRLREKLGGAAKIETVRGMGYRAE